MPESLCESATLSRVAYLKAIGHAAKFPWAEVNGVFLGKLDGNTLEIVDAIPLFHTSTLAPSLETALSLIEEYCESEFSPEGIKLVGYYHANARVDHNAISPLADRIASTIASKCPSAPLIILDNAGLSDPSKSSMLAFQTGPGGWKGASDKFLKIEDSSKTYEEVNKLIGNDTQLKKLVDFDECFEDISLDWRNQTFGGL